MPETKPRPDVPDYQRPSIDCDLSRIPMEMAASYLGPSFEYTLHVHENLAPYARRLIREWGAEFIDHPFAPHIRLFTCNSLGEDEWYVSANGKHYGSPGA